MSDLKDILKTMHDMDIGQQYYMQRPDSCWILAGISNVQFKLVFKRCIRIIFMKCVSFMYKMSSFSLYLRPFSLVAMQCNWCNYPPCTVAMELLSTRVQQTKIRKSMFLTCNVVDVIIHLLRWLLLVRVQQARNGVLG